MIATSLGDILLCDERNRIITDGNGRGLLGSISNWELISREGNRRITARFKVGTQVLPCELVRVECHKGACGNQFAPGALYAPYINAKIKNCSRNLSGVELLYQVGILINGDYEYIDMGYFTVLDPKVTTSQTEFTAVGRLSANGNTEYVSLLSYPTSVQDVIDEIETALGVPILIRGLSTAGTMEIIPTGTIRDALASIAGCLGGFVTEDNAGNVVISKYGYGSTIRVTPDRSLSLPEVWEKKYQVTGIRVVVPDQTTDEETIPGETFSVGTPVMEVTNECMTRALFNSMYQNIRGYSFTPADIDLSLGDPRLEPWDAVAVEDLNGTVHEVPCFELIHTYHGGLSTQIIADVDSPAAEEMQVTGPMGKYVQQVETKGRHRYNILKRDIGRLESTIGDVEEGLETQITQTAQQFDVKVSTKKRVFTSQPTPPYDVGDLWTQGSNGDILVCKRSKSEGSSFSSSDWGVASKYTDDSALATFLDGDYAEDLADLQSQIDGKAETWYQASDPSSGWSTAEKPNHKGDLWYRTSDGKTFRYTGSSWLEQSIPEEVFDEIDGKASIYVGTSAPTSPAEGDLWFKGANQPILTYVNSTWKEYNKYTDDTLASAEVTNRTALIRDMASGTLTCYVGNSVGVYTNASGSVDIVTLSWNGNTPRITGTLASYSSSGIVYNDALSYAIGSNDAYIHFNPSTGEITIGGDVVFDNTNSLSDLIEKLNEERLEAYIEYTGTSVILTAMLTQNGDDITDTYAASNYKWYYKTADAFEYIGSGHTVTVPKVTFGRAGEVRLFKNKYLIDSQGRYITDKNGNKLLAYTEV